MVLEKFMRKCVNSRKIVKDVDVEFGAEIAHSERDIDVNADVDKGGICIWN